MGLIAGAWASLATGETYFNDEGVAFHSFETPGRQRQPLWRLLDAKKTHAFTSSNALKKKLMDREGAVLETSGIYVSIMELEGMVPLYEFKRKKDSRTILIVGEEGRRDLLTRPDEFEEIPQQVYVFPPEFRGPESSPVRLLRNPFTDVRIYTVSQEEIEKVLVTRDKRMKRLRTAARKAVKEGNGVEVVAVGETAEFGNFGWRFQHSASLGREVDVGNGKVHKTRGQFVSFDVTVSNRGSKSIKLRAPYLLTGQGTRVPVSQEVTDAYVSPELRFEPDKKLGPGERKRFQFVYDIPIRAHDVSIEVYSSDPAVVDVMVLDTGR